jgi:hypothetical protein
MSLSPTTLPIAAAPLARTRSVARGSEASSEFRTLDGECGSETRPRAEARRTTSASRVFRSGTGSGEPLWNGPSLRPAFVAQVIGQVMMEPRRSVLPAYREAVAQIPPGSFIDDAV